MTLITESPINYFIPFTNYLPIIKACNGTVISGQGAEGSFYASLNKSLWFSKNNLQVGDNLGIFSEMQPIAFCF